MAIRSRLGVLVLDIDYRLSPGQQIRSWKTMEAHLTLLT